MAPIPTPIGYPIDCGLTLICAVYGARLGAGTARCRDPDVLFPIGPIHPSSHAASTLEAAIVCDAVGGTDAHPC